MQRAFVHAAHGQHSETLPLLPASNPPREGAPGALQHFFDRLVIHRSLFALVVRELAVSVVNPVPHVIGGGGSLINGTSYLHGRLCEELPERELAQLGSRGSHGSARRVGLVAMAHSPELG